MRRYVQGSSVAVSHGQHCCCRTANMRLLVTNRAHWTRTVQSLNSHIGNSAGCSFAGPGKPAHDVERTATPDLIRIPFRMSRVESNTENDQRENGQTIWSLVSFSQSTNHYCWTDWEVEIPWKPTTMTVGRTVGNCIGLVSREEVVLY